MIENPDIFLNFTLNIFMEICNYFLFDATNAKLLICDFKPCIGLKDFRYVTALRFIADLPTTHILLFY